MLMTQYKLIEYNDRYALEFVEGPYEGIIFSYDRVNLEEDEKQGVLKLHYDYVVHDGIVGNANKEEFEHVIGDILSELIMEGIYKNNNVYYGGTDEDRDVNSDGAGI